MRRAAIHDASLSFICGQYFGGLLAGRARVEHIGVMHEGFAGRSAPR
jgi:hypothetical protein